MLVPGFLFLIKTEILLVSLCFNWTIFQSSC